MSDAIPLLCFTLYKLFKMCETIPTGINYLFEFSFFLGIKAIIDFCRYKHIVLDLIY